MQRARPRGGIHAEARDFTTGGAAAVRYDRVVLAFSDDLDRLARFQREAQVLASLNHPRLASIYGIEEGEGTRALVLELVEGPTLADRIAQGPLPIDEAQPIAQQIAEALETTREGDPSQSPTLTAAATQMGVIMGTAVEAPCHDTDELQGPVREIGAWVVGNRPSSDLERQNEDDQQQADENTI